MQLEFVERLVLARFVPLDLGMDVGRGDRIRPPPRRTFEPCMCPPWLSGNTSSSFFGKWFLLDGDQLTEWTGTEGSGVVS
jgi:hypothetical protein